MYTKRKNKLRDRATDQRQKMQMKQSLEGNWEDINFP